MTIKPRAVCDPDILDALSELHKQAAIADQPLTASLMRDACGEIRELRWKLKEMERKLSIRDRADVAEADIAAMRAVAGDGADKV